MRKCTYSRAEILGAMAKQSQDCQYEKWVSLVGAGELADLKQEYDFCAFSYMRAFARTQLAHAEQKWHDIDAGQLPRWVRPKNSDVSGVSGDNGVLIDNWPMAEKGSAKMALEVTI